MHFVRFENRNDADHWVKQAHHQKIQADSKTGIVHFITAIRTNERETLNSKRETEGGGNWRINQQTIQT